MVGMMENLIYILALIVLIQSISKLQKCFKLRTKADIVKHQKEILEKAEPMNEKMLNCARLIATFILVFCLVLSIYILINFK